MLLLFAMIFVALFGLSPSQVMLRPTSYDLTLDLLGGLDSNNYTGTMKIYLPPENETTITLSSSGIQILNVALIIPTAYYNITISPEYSVDQTSETITIIASNVPWPSHYEFQELSIDFSARFQTGSTGFYKTSYQSNNTTRWIASTQFGPSFVRRAFPCFDRPQLSVPLSLTMKLPEGLDAVTNMPTQSTVSGATEKTVVFEKGPAMLPYLYAWYVSDSSFAELASFTSAGIKCQIHGRSSLKADVKLAQEITSRVIEKLQSIKEVSYTSRGTTALDQIIIPNFHDRNAKNWGLIAHREDAIVNTSSSNARNIQDTTMNVAQKLAQQWYSILVEFDEVLEEYLVNTVANYLKYVITMEIEPSWNLKNQFLTDVFQSSMENDVDYRSNRTNPQNTTQVKDLERDASIMIMFSSIIGRRQFVDSYMSTAIGWNFPTPAPFRGVLPDEDLMNKFKRWIVTSGHPVVKVSKSKVSGSTTLHFSQVREVMNGDEIAIDFDTPITIITNIPNNEGPVDLVPLGEDVQATENYSYTTDGSDDTQRVDFWLKNGIEGRPVGPNLKWYLINAEGTGYYRVQYDAENWRALREAIGASSLQPQTRAQLVSDAINLATSGLMEPQLAFEFIDFLQQETDLLVWKAAVKAFNRMRNFILGQKIQYEFEMYVESLMNNATISMTELSSLTEKSHYEKVLIIFLVNHICVYRSSVCSILQNLGLGLSDLESLDVTIEESVLCQKVKVDEVNWNNLYSIYVNSEDPIQKQRYLRSLACSTDPALQTKLLNMFLEPNRMSFEDLQSVVSSICESKNGTLTVLSFIGANGAQLASYMGSKMDMLTILTIVAEKLYNDELLDKMRSLLNETSKLQLEEIDKVELIEKAEQINRLRKTVASRVCQGLNVPYLEPQNPEPEDPIAEPNSSLHLLPSLYVICVTLIIQKSIL